MKKSIGWLLFILGIFALVLATVVDILGFLDYTIALVLLFGGWYLAHPKK